MNKICKTHKKIKSPGLCPICLVNERDALRQENERLKGLLKIAKCPNCDGSGCIPHQVSERRCVTRDMAIDAGDEQLEGALYTDEKWEMEQCQWCYEVGQALR